MIGSQRSPSPQPSSQRPPQPSSAPHALVFGHRRVQLQVKRTGSHVAKGFSHGPTQRPPQPSSVPHGVESWQSVVHRHRPITQRSRGVRVQGGSQPQVGVQVPLTQTAPDGQVTPAQGLATQRPLTQNSPAAHATVSHAVRGEQVM
jgi:hypothetical protein